MAKFISISAAITCQPGYYKCQNSRCIESSWICDGHVDCPGKDDEAPTQNCMFYLFLLNQFVLSETQGWI